MWLSLFKPRRGRVSRSVLLLVLKAAGSSSGDNGRGTSQPRKRRLWWHSFSVTAEEQELGQCVKVGSPMGILVANWRGAMFENIWFLAC